jgi:hypothetical protein
LVITARRFKTEFLAQGHAHGGGYLDHASLGIGPSFIRASQTIPVWSFS